MRAAGELQQANAMLHPPMVFAGSDKCGFWNQLWCLLEPAEADAASVYRFGRKRRMWMLEQGMSRAATLRRPCNPEKLHRHGGDAGTTCEGVATVAGEAASIAGKVTADDGVLLQLVFAGAGTGVLQCYFRQATMLWSATLALDAATDGEGGGWRRGQRCFKVGRLAHPWRVSTAASAPVFPLLLLDVFFLKNK